MEKNASLAELISLKGKRSLITGSASGIGEAIAYRFAEAGSDLVLIDIDYDGLIKVKESIKQMFNVDIDIYKVDLAYKSEIDSLWGRLRGKEPDILVNNAGIYVFKGFLELDEDFLEKILSVNLKAVLWMCQNMIRYRGKRGGIIINISSVEAILPFAKNLVHYDISKIGVIGLTRALAREYGRMGYRINVIVPGGIETKGVKRLKKEAFLKLKIDIIKSGLNYLRRLPLGRLGKPDEVARVALFLASDLSSYVHGAIIPVDGGFLSA